MADSAMASPDMPGFDARLRELGITLPAPAVPSFSYVPSLVSGNQLFIAGQLGLRDGALVHKGRLGAAATLEDGKAAARLCGLNVLAQVHDACGGTLDRVVRCLRLTGFVSTAPDCHDQAAAMNGCSDLMLAVFGPAGRHTRTTVGVASLPFDALVEVDAIFEIAPA